MSPPRLIVVMPARDAEDMIGAALDALLADGFAPADIALADDGSTDGTAREARARGIEPLTLEGGHGPGRARNAAAASVPSELILFVDADVVVAPGTRARVLRFFEEHPDHAGVIGSYDDAPPAPGTLSRVRNLLHHHVHHASPGDLPSFWTGLGAIRRADFEAAGGFRDDEPLEDVGLGLRLARMGRRIRLDPGLRGTHLKRWTLRSMVHADLVKRARPWVAMLRDPANAHLPSALNVSLSGALCVLAAGVAGLGLPVMLANPPIGLALVAGGLGAIAALQAEFLALVARRLGVSALPVALGTLAVHHACAGLGYAWARAEEVMPRARRPRS